MSSTSFRVLALASLGLLVAPAAEAHDSAAFMASRQAAVPGSVVVPPGGDIGFESQGISLLSLLPVSEFGGSTGADCWGYTSPSGREYAIMTTSDAISFVEVTDPGRPQIVQTFGAVNSLWRDAKVYQDHAYWVSEGGDGVQVADMSQIDSGIVSYVGGFFPPGTSASHNVAIDVDSGFLYVTGGGSTPVEGLRIFNLSNPSSPSYVNSWDDRYVHDAQIVRYTSGPFANQQIAFCFSETSSGGGTPGIDILNVTNKNNIQQISDFFYSSAVFSHQGWLTEDRTRLYLNDEIDEITFGGNTLTRILNVSNLNNPSEVGTFTSGVGAVDHNLYTKANLLYEANYRSGLRVFDTTNQNSPVQTAWFDTFPADDAATTNGLWSVYPYYDSGTIVGSDLERGMFVWRLGDPELTFDLAGGVPELIDNNGEQLIVSIGTNGGAALAGATATLHVDSGSGFVDYPMGSLGGGDYMAAFPLLDCGEAVTWYVSGQTTAGVTWTDPPAGPCFVYASTAATGEVLVDSDDMESNPGWDVTAPGDDATTGIWERVNPVGTTAQPEDDHTPSGTQCWVTGQGVPFGGLGDNDVDGGKTTLTTGDYDLSGGDATISYWRWYSNTTGGAPNADTFVIDISNNSGGSWVNVETVGPTGSETAGGWFQHQFVVSDFVAPTADVRLRFIASDEGDGSIVEAAIDDLEVVRYDCGTCQTDLGFGGPGNATLSVCGQSLDTGNSATMLLEQAAPNSLAVLFLGFANSPVPFKGGQLVPVPFVLSVGLTTDPSGTIAFPIPGGGGPGTLYAQYAIADGGQPFGVALSNAVELVFGP